MAKILKKILKLHEDMENQVFSIKTNLSDIIDIANLPGMHNETVDLLLSETKMIFTKIGYYEMYIQQL